MGNHSAAPIAPCPSRLPCEHPASEHYEAVHGRFWIRRDCRAIVNERECGCTCTEIISEPAMLSAVAPCPSRVPCEHPATEHYEARNEIGYLRRYCRIITGHDPVSGDAQTCRCSAAVSGPEVAS